MKVSGPGHYQIPNYYDIFRVKERISISSSNYMQNTENPERGYSTSCSILVFFIFYSEHSSHTVYPDPWVRKKYSVGFKETQNFCATNILNRFDTNCCPVAHLDTGQIQDYVNLRIKRWQTIMRVDANQITVAFWKVFLTVYYVLYSSSFFC